MAHSGKASQRSPGMIRDCVVLASGAGSNFEALARAFPERMAAMISDVPASGALERARALGVPAFLCDRKDYPDRRSHEAALLETLRGIFAGSNLRLLLLAGYMRILSAEFLKELQQTLGPCKIWNLHPSSPGVYKGARAYEFAVERRYPYWGLTVHEVTPELDSGPVIATLESTVHPWESAAALRDRFRPLEHGLFVQAVKKECS